MNRFLTGIHASTATNVIHLITEYIKSINEWITFDSIESRASRENLEYSYDNEIIPQVPKIPKSRISQESSQ